MEPMDGLEITVEIVDYVLNLKLINLMMINWRRMKVKADSGLNGKI